MAPNVVWFGFAKCSVVQCWKWLGDGGGDGAEQYSVV